MHHLRLHSLHRLALTGLATAALLGALPAHAVGRLTDVQVLDRDSGETLQVHRHQGEYWVAGRPGARYAVSVRNTTGARVMTVVSVDGVNVVSGETAAWNQTGYVLSPWQPYDITGWRKSSSEVAAFHFIASPASYAARTGRPDHVGVIGVAVFREKVAPVAQPWPEQRPEPLPHSRHDPRERLARSEAAGAPPAPAASGATANAQDSATAPATEREASAARRPASRLGTGHGEREDAWVGHTTFERRSERPDDLIRIRYDSHENLVAMGILSARPVPPRPNPFPAPAQPGYVPDPY